MTMPTTTSPSVVKFNCPTFANLRVCQKFLQLSNESRLNEIIIFVPAGNESLLEGPHKLVSVFKLLAGDLVRHDLNNSTDDALGNADCSHLEILENCQILLKQMSSTRWLTGITIESTSGDDNIFATSTSDLPQFLSNLSELVGSVFNQKMKEPLYSLDILTA